MSIKTNSLKTAIETAKDCANKRCTPHYVYHRIRDDISQWQITTAWDLSANNFGVLTHTVLPNGRTYSLHGDME